jgi:hypothetical protein
MIRRFFILITISLLIGCSQPGYNVGDIPFDERNDSPDFKVCNEGNIEQYYIRASTDIAPGYQGEKKGLEREILEAYHFPVTKNEDGYLTIRFIVNCNGETGRFRIESMDFDYQEKSFKPQITDQLLEIVKSLDGWIPRKRNGQNLDFYQYLTFRMEEGQIVKILP